MKQALRFMLLTGGLAVSGSVLATPCQSVLSSFSSAVSTNSVSSAQQILSQHPECFGGSDATSQIQVNGTLFTQIAAVSNALAMRFVSGGPGPFADSGLRGASAGAKVGQWNAWSNLSKADTKQRYANLAGTITNNGSDVLNLVVGGDYMLSPRTVVGLSFAMDRSAGAGSQTGAATVNLSTGSGYTLAPYVGFQINKEWSVDASAGVGTGGIDTAGTNSVDVDKWFAGANLNYNRWSGNWQFSGKAGYLYAEEDYGDIRVTGAPVTGTAARNKLGQAQVSVQAGYWMNGVMPYASLKYSADVHRSTTQFGGGSTPIGKDAWIWALGVNFFSLSSGVSGGAYFQQEEGRQNQKNNSLMANINIRF